jgi:hypothetical protein
MDDTGTINKQGQIGSELVVLEERLKELEGRIGELNNRLTPVSNSPSVKSECPKEEESPAVPLAGKIIRCRKTVESFIDSINETIKRLEI